MFCFRAAGTDCGVGRPGIWQLCRKTQNDSTQMRVLSLGEEPQDLV